MTPIQIITVSTNEKEARFMLEKIGNEVILYISNKDADGYFDALYPQKKRFKNGEEALKFGIELCFQKQPIISANNEVSDILSTQVIQEITQAKTTTIS